MLITPFYSSYGELNFTLELRTRKQKNAIFTMLFSIFVFLVRF